MKDKAARGALVQRQDKKSSGAALDPGARADVDKRTAARLRRGELPIEGRLDLHGLDRRAAQTAMFAFLETGHAAGRRCVLVITGRGEGREGGGVLAGLFPSWIAEAAQRGWVLAWSPARPEHGGRGACYVLLKRKRGSSD